MRNLFILKDVAYGVNSSDTVISDIHDVDTLRPGSVAFFTPSGTLLTAANAAASVGDTKTFIAAVGTANGNPKVLELPRRGVYDLNRVNYRAYTRPVETLQVRGIAADDTGNFSLKVRDVSFTSRNLTAMQTGSFYKTATTTVEAAIDGLVASFNANNDLCTIAKTGTSPNFNITITPDNDGVYLDTTGQELLESSTVTVTTAAVEGSGVGTDMRALERDVSVELGNGNYIDYTQEWYSTELEASATGTYDMLTLAWTGIHESPTGNRPVAHNTLVIAPLSTATSGATNQGTAAILAILALIIPNSFSGTTNAETGTDDGTNFDGVAGN